MKQKIFSAFLLISILLATSCDWEDYHDGDYDDYDDHHGYMAAKVEVAVGDVYRITNGEYFYDYVPDYKVYVFTSEDADRYGIFSESDAFMTGRTGEDGRVEFDFSSRDLDRHRRFVFVVFYDERHATRQEIELRRDDFAELTMFASGEQPLEPVFRNINSRYGMVSVLDGHTYVDLLGFNGKNSIEFSLPRNTVYWYYTFTSFDYTDYSYDFSLYGALNHYFSLRSGVDVNAVRMIEPVPTETQNRPKVYLLDERNSLSFNHDHNFEFISYFKDVDSEVVEEDEHVGGHYVLAFQNTSDFDMRVFVQVVAVVEE